jgi:signal transduction histidine kinase
MKRWPLRWKIALYAAALGIVATLAGAATTWTLMRYSEVAALDRQLARDARELLTNAQRFNAADLQNRADVEAKLVPLAWRDRMVELTGPKGELLYLSPNLGEPLLGDGRDELHTREINGRSMRVGAFRENGLTLRVGADLHEIHQIGRDIIFGMAGAIPTVLLVVTLGGRWIARRALAPIEMISQAAARITAKRLDQRLPLPATNDELAELIKVLNATFERLQRSFEQSVRFSADASHRLKTPLSVLRAGIEEILTDAETPPKTQLRASALLDRIRRLTSVSEDLLLLARADAGRLELHFAPLDLSELLDGLLDDARALAERNMLTIEADVPKTLPLIGDRAAIASVLQNLLGNAINFNEPRGCICISARMTGGGVEVCVKNNGEPIAAGRAPLIFERFYRARGDERTEGNGLGLSIARELAIGHGGEVVLVRSDEEWTEFRLWLPERPPSTSESRQS